MIVALEATGEVRARKDEEEEVSLSANGQSWFHLLCCGADSRERVDGENCGEGMLLDVTDSCSNVNTKESPHQAKVCWCKGVYMTGAVLAVTAVVPLIGAFLNIVTFWAIEAHILLAKFSWFWWFVWIVCLTTMAISMSQVLPESVGSGIPQLRAIFSGARLAGFLRSRLLPAKLLSSLALVSSGLWVGFEGPMVHMGCLVASSLTRLPIFARIRESPELFNSFIAVSGGAGLSCTLGAPIGGVLYTIEEVASCYRINQLWYAFLAGVPGAIIFRLLISWWEAFVTGGRIPFSFLAGVLEPKYVIPFEFGILDFCWTAVIGIIGGFSGVGFIWINSGTVKLTRYLAGRYVVFRFRIVFAAAVVVASSLLFFPGWTGEFMCLGPFSVLKDLTTPGDELLVERGWNFVDIRVSLCIFFLVKLSMLAITIALPASTGMYFATMACGAALGRLFGLLWTSINPGSSVGPDIFALIGASSVASSVTQSVSTIVIMLELCGRMQLLTPLIVATLIAVSISRLCTGRIGIYEQMALDLNLSFVPDLHVSLASMTAEQICNPLQNCLVLLEKESLKHLVELVEQHDTTLNVFPVVNNRRNMMFLGFLSIIDLRVFLRRVKSVCNNLPSFAETADQLEIYQSLCRQFCGVHISKGFIELSPQTPLPIVHMLFMRAGEDMLPITSEGKLLGLVYRSNFAAFLHGHKPTATDVNEDGEMDIEKEWVDRQVKLGHRAQPGIYF